MTLARFIALFPFASVMPVLVACGDPGVDADAPFDETAEPALSWNSEEVDQVAQELTTIEDYWSEPFAVPGLSLHLGPRYAVFPGILPFQSCWGVSLVSVDSGRVHIPTPDCSRPLAAVGDDSVYVSVSGSNDITAVGVNEKREPILVRMADTSGDTRGKMLLSSSHVYWADGAGIRRLTRSWPGEVTTLRSDSAAELIGIEGSTVYYKTLTFGVRELRRMTTTGGSDTLLYIGGGALQDLSFDERHFYWVDNTSTPPRIRRLPKSGGANAETFVSSTAKAVRLPRSNGTHLYVVAVRDGSVTVKRQTLATGYTVTSNNLGWVPNEMTLTGTHVYTTWMSPGIFGVPFQSVGAARGAL